MSKYTLLLISILLMTSRVGSAQVRRGTGLIHRNYSFSEVQLYSCTSRLSVKPTHREQFLQASRTIAEATRKEAGCQSFYVYEDVNAPNTFLLTSTWKSHTALHAHIEAAYMVAYFEQLAHWLTAPSPFTVYDVVKSHITTIDAKP